MRLARAVSEIVRSADMRQKLTQQGWDVAGSLPDELRQRINADTQALGEIIRTQKIELN
jgi:tripartite-type tricarboxylate transporter receptor subunit TctC